MTPRHPRSADWPTRWLMTDERMGDRLFEAVGRLPEGGGILFRHTALARCDRLKLGLRVARAAARGGHALAVASDVALARMLGAELVHNPNLHPGLMPHSRSVHDEAEADHARQTRASLVFVSPVFPTRSHPGAAALGRDAAIRLAGRAGGLAIGLGGMNESAFFELEGAFHGYAGIDCWLDGGGVGDVTE